MQKIRLIVLAAAGLFALYHANAQDSSHYFSLQQALEYGRQHNAQVKNALLDIQLQEQVNREVTGSAYPQISGRAGITDNVKISKIFLPAGSPNFFEGSSTPLTKDTYVSAALFSAPWSGVAGVTLTQLLFDGQVFTGLQARKTLINYKEKAADVTFEQIRLNIAKIYYQLVVSKTQLALIDSNLSFVQKNIHDTKIMYDNGFAENVDIDKLTVTQANLLSQKKQVTNATANGYLALKMLMGMPMKEELVLTDELTDDKLKEGIIESVTAFDYSQRKDFQAAVLGRKLNELEIQRYKYSKIPSVALNGSWDYMTQTNRMPKMFNGTAEWYPVSSLSLNINIPIFNGFATNARIAQAKIKLQQTENQIDALKLTIDQERESAVNTFKSAITDMDYQKQNMQLAEKVYNQTKKKYETGTGSQLEIDNARVQLQAAQTNYYTALYNAIIAKVDFLKATGKL